MLHINDSEVNALIRLVEDPDPQIYTQVRHKLVSYGSSILPNIENTWLKGAHNNDHQSKLEDIISEIRISELSEKLVKWKNSSNRDLLKGALIISQYQYPNITELMLEKEIEKIQQKVWLEINDSNTAFETVKIFNHVMFDICGFKGSRKNFFSPNNSFLYSALRQRQGTPLTLSIIYSIVAQRLEIPIYGVNLPNQFILGFVDENKTLKMLNIDSERQVLFYINPYAKGRIFDHIEIENYLKALKLPIEKEHYEPCSNTVILKRMLSNLCFSYKKIGDKKKVEELKKLNAIL
ncbi:MAG: transglutaminase-like domain-containing protein [Putridiphycobacter sp.]|nr:transglutaminase-like domain-containing protein [Putridiphycobacter sp.]